MREKLRVKSRLDSLPINWTERAAVRLAAVTFMEIYSRNIVTDRDLRQRNEAPRGLPNRH